MIWTAWRRGSSRRAGHEGGGDVALLAGWALYQHCEEFLWHALHVSPHRWAMWPGRPALLLLCYWLLLIVVSCNQFVMFAVHTLLFGVWSQQWLITPGLKSISACDMQHNQAGELRVLLHNNSHPTRLLLVAHYVIGARYLRKYMWQVFWDYTLCVVSVDSLACLTLFLWQVHGLAI